jgi:ferredoxin--NADP+ reductase
MHTILLKEMLIERTWHMRVMAPLIARKCRAGQFLILRIDEKGERIPLTIADWNSTEGTIDIYFQEIGASTERLARLEEGDSILDVVGPLGNPSHVEKLDGTFVMVEGGFGIAAGYPLPGLSRRPVIGSSRYWGEDQRPSDLRRDAECCLR